MSLSWSFTRFCIYLSLDSWLIYLSLSVCLGFIVISSAWRLFSVFAVFWDSLLLLRYVEFQYRQVELTQIIVSTKVYWRSRNTSPQYWNYSNCRWSFYLNKSIHLYFQNTMKNINSSQQPLLELLYLLIMIKLKCHILMTDWRKQMTNAQNARWHNQVRRCWYTLLGGTSELHAVRLKQRLRFKSALNVFLQATVSGSSTEHWSSSKNSW